LDEPVDSLMTKISDAVRRGDHEWVRGLNAMLDLAIQLGNHALVAEQSKRNRT
jgi:hypothetical protein